MLGMFICMGALLIGNLLRSFILDDSASLDDRPGNLDPSPFFVWKS